jgi:hypothetical protein
VIKPKKKMLKEIEHVIDVIGNDRYRPSTNGKDDASGEGTGHILVTGEEAEALKRLTRTLVRHVGFGV